MSVEGLKPNPVENFGGFVSLPDPSDVPVGMSPECGDVIFATGRVQSRPGLGAPLPDQAPNKINGLKTYVKIDLERRLIVLLSNGTLKVERSAGSLDTITTNLKSDLLYKSVTLFGREYMAFSQDGVGEEFPFYFDDVNFLRVSPSGPGAAPTAINDETNDQDNSTGQDEDHELNTGGAGGQGNLGQAIQFQTNVKVDTIKLFLKSIGTPAGFVRIRLKEGDPNDLVNPDNVGVTSDVDVTGIGAGYSFVTFTFPSPLELGPLQDNGQYHIVFEGDAAYDAAYVAATDAIVWGADGTSPTYAFGSFIFFDGVDAWGADLTKDFLFEVDTISGVIPAGVHKVMVYFETDTGYLTKASPSFSYTADGNKAVALSNIPIGPDYVVARRVAFTIVDGEEFFHIANTMKIGDNTTTEFLVDFTDVDLISGQLVDKQLRALQLPPEACVTSYANRLVWVGERNRMQQWINLGFDGGWLFQTAEDVPLGWTLSTTGGKQEPADAIAGNAYKIIGDGTAFPGLISQPANVDQYNALPLIETGRAYRVKARLKRSAGMIAGSVHIDLQSTTGGIDTVGLSVAAGSISDTSYTEFEFELTASLTTIPTDLRLRVFADGTPTSAEFFLIDEIEIWPSDRELNPSTARVSDPDNPEFYDGVTGLISIAQDNGESLRAVFVIRDILYFVKERSLWATRDDGIGPPSTWTVEEVSPVVGTFSPHGVASAEDWTVIAGQEGAYFFDGGRPLKLSNEIDAEWRRIDWQRSHLLWVINHVEEQRFMIGFPDTRTIPTNNEPDQVWMMDYQEGFGDPLRNNGKGRHWAKWQIPANSAAMVERGFSRTATAYYGSNGGPSGTQNVGEILAQDIVGAGGLSSGLRRTDNGVVINAFYRTAFLSHTDFAGRQLFAYLTTYAYGNGTLDIDMIRPDESVVPVRGFTLPGLGVNQRKDLERQINLISERVSFRFGIDVLDESFTVSKFVPWSKASPFDFVRGTN
jgi:hypothetical protein